MPDFHTQIMQRCLQLATNGLGNTYPNPMVGCIITYNQRIIAESWHKKAGQAHAEVNAINQIEDKSILRKCTLYVSLEPCAHYGKTPPCAHLIVQHKIPKVVIATLDPFAKVNGLGVKYLIENGVDVKIGCLEKESQTLNKRFFTYHRHKKPYVILKWAQTANGFMATKSKTQQWISNTYAKQLTHKWRTQEQAILVGSNTVKIDNPRLNARLWKGHNPIRVIIDKDLGLNGKLHVFDGTQPTLVFTQKESASKKNIDFIKVDFNDDLWNQILEELYKKEIQSIIIEGGVATLQQFITQNLWNEARIFTAKTNWEDGILAPIIKGEIIEEKSIGDNQLTVLSPAP